MQKKYYPSRILGYCGHTVVTRPSQRSQNYISKSSNKKPHPDLELNRLNKHRRRMRCNQC